MMLRRFFLLGTSSLLLSGCGGDLLGLGPGQAGAIYPLRPAFPPGNGPKVNWALAIFRPDLAAGLDTERIALTQPGGSMDYYANADYPDRLGVLVQQAVLDGFEASGRIDAVANEQDALHADYNLAVEVKDFAAHYSQLDGIPTVAVSITAKLTTAHGRAILATFSTSKRGAASANSAAAVVEALQQALGAAVLDIVNWTLATAPAVPPSADAEAKPAEELLHDLSRGRGDKIPR